MIRRGRYKMVVRERPGFAILIVLVAIAIMLLLYSMDIKAIFGPNLPTKYSPKDQRPWLEEERILGPDQIIKMPEAPKATLDEDLSLTGAVTLKGEDRGEVRLRFTTMGEVSGSWYCEYSHEDRDYRYEATFAGNIDIDKTYTDKQGEDKSLLYFITKGRYTQTVYNQQTQQASEDKGFVYTTSWLDTDYSAFGMITITTDKTWSATYDFQTEE